MPVVPPGRLLAAAARGLVPTPVALTAAAPSLLVPLAGLAAGFPPITARTVAAPPVVRRRLAARPALTAVAVRLSPAPIASRLTVAAIAMAAVLASLVAPGVASAPVLLAAALSSPSSVLPPTAPLVAFGPASLAAVLEVSPVRRAGFELAGSVTPVLARDTVAIGGPAIGDTPLSFSTTALLPSGLGTPAAVPIVSLAGLAVPELVVPTPAPGSGSASSAAGAVVFVALAAPVAVAGSLGSLSSVAPPGIRRGVAAAGPLSARQWWPCLVATRRLRRGAAVTRRPASLPVATVASRLAIPPIVG